MCDRAVVCEASGGAHSRPSSLCTGTPQRLSMYILFFVVGNERRKVQSCDRPESAVTPRSAGSQPTTVRLSRVFFSLRSVSIMFLAAFPLCSPDSYPPCGDVDVKHKTVEKLSPHVAFLFFRSDLRN